MQSLLNPAVGKRLNWEPAVSLLDLHAPAQSVFDAFAPRSPEDSGFARWMRRTVYSVFLVQMTFLALWSGNGRAAVSNVLQLFIGLGATAVCLCNARLRPLERRFWQLIAAGFFLWTAALGVSIVYENVLHATTTSWWPSDLLFFVSPAPFLLAAFDDGSRHLGINLVDVLQLVTVSVAVYLCFIYAPWRVLGDSIEFGLREWKIFLVRDTLLFLLALGRLVHDRRWSSSGALAAYLLVSGIGEGVYLLFQAQNLLHSGTLADIVWSGPFVLAVWLAQHRDLPAGQPRPAVKGSLFYSGLVLHALLLAVVLFSVAGFSGAQLRVAQAGLVFSFLLFAARMAGVHRALAARVTEVQELNEGLETRVRERTSQLQAANRDLQRQNAEVLRLSQLKSRFMANVSHEFRTPLNVLTGFSSLLLSGAAGDPAKSQQYLEHIRKSALDLSGLVSDVLDYADLDAGDVKLNMGPVDLGIVCRESVLALKPVLFDREVTVDCRVPAAAITADESRLRQVLLNLLSTAIQFTPRHGTIRFHGFQFPGCAEIRICDGGHGIPPERIDEIFSEFSQLGPDSNREFAGAGLRLALARRLIEMHGWSIRAESSPGNGTAFVFTIPMAPQRQVAPEPVPSPRSS